MSNGQTLVLESEEQRLPQILSKKKVVSRRNTRKSPAGSKLKYQPEPKIEKVQSMLNLKTSEECVLTRRSLNKGVVQQRSEEKLY